MGAPFAWSHWPNLQFTPTSSRTYTHLLKQFFSSVGLGSVRQRLKVETLANTRCRLTESAIRVPASRMSTVTKAIAIGDKLPQASFKYFDSEGNMKEITTEGLCKGKKVVLFAVPGAFTPTCSLKHLPGFVDKADEIKQRGVDAIACISVNDAFVMDAWGKSVGSADKIMMLADGNAQFTKAIGVELDLTDKGLGLRSRRYAMLIDDQVVKVINLEEGGAFTVSSADNILEALLSK